MAYNSRKVYVVEGSTMQFLVELASALRELRHSPITANVPCGELANQLDDRLQKDLSLRYGISSLTPDLALYRVLRKVSFLIFGVSVLLLYFHLERAAIAVIAGVSALVAFIFATEWLQRIVDSWQRRRDSELKATGKHE